MRRCSPEELEAMRACPMLAPEWQEISLRRMDAIRHGTHHMFIMNEFDYAAPAEVYTSKSRGSSKRPVTYRRFDNGAEAVQFAIEELGADVLYGTVIESNEQRFEAAAIRELYQSGAYPLSRRPQA
jgi:hypothetical protein